MKKAIFVAIFNIIGCSLNFNPVGNNSVAAGSSDFNPVDCSCEDSECNNGCFTNGSCQDNSCQNSFFQCNENGMCQLESSCSSYQRNRGNIQDSFYKNVCLFTPDQDFYTTIYICNNNLSEEKPVNFFPGYNCDVKKAINMDSNIYNVVCCLDKNYRNY